MQTFQKEITQAQGSMIDAVETILSSIDSASLKQDLDAMFDLSVTSDGFIPGTIATYRTLERFLQELKQIEEMKAQAQVQEN